MDPGEFHPDSPAPTPGPTVRLAAVGDLLLDAAPDGSAGPRDPQAMFGDLVRGCDLAFGNLECTLPGDGRTVPTVPRVVANEAMVRAVAAAGFGVVTLANNHAFDCLEPGFERLRSLLDEVGVRHFGAGLTLAEAVEPVLFEGPKFLGGLDGTEMPKWAIGGRVRLGFLAGVDESSGPSRLAGPGSAGVAPLDLDRLCAQIRELRSAGMLPIASLHWGRERFDIPSPDQIRQARTLIDAGAALILGHHPHVLQGLERLGRSAVAYSLGNFLAGEVHFPGGDVLTWNCIERTGCVLAAELDADGVRSVSQLPTLDDTRRVTHDTSGRGDRRIARVNALLARGVTPARYARERFRVETIRPIVNHFRWSAMKHSISRRLRRAPHREEPK